MSRCSLMGKQRFRKAKTGGSIPPIGSTNMKIKLPLNLDFFRHKTLAGLLITSLLLNIILWIIWLTKIKLNYEPTFFASGVILLNTLLSLYFYRFQILASYILMSEAILIQILTVVYLRYLLTLIAI